MRRFCTLIICLTLASIAGAGNVFDLQQRKASHWCWQPITTQSPPSVKNDRWIQSPIDRFILAKQEAANLLPSPPADRRVLIRRAYFDVIGLPPSPQEVDAFVNDQSPDAFAKVVDHLLTSDHFGERWARHWMDVVRYAETRGHEYDPLIPNAWQYRDYLIRAFNADVPYNQFLTEHVAGDLLSKPRLNPTEGYNESILGTGYWFLGEEVHSPVDIRQDEADRMTNRIDTFTKAFLGLTVGCARCHDHKFDAISQKDFYALNGFVLSASYRQVPFKSMQQNRAVAVQLETLRATARPKLAAEWLNAQRPGIERTAEYLLACREARAEGRDAAANVGEIADAKSLDPNLLREWLSELTLAERQPDHFLHAFALLAKSRKSADETFVATRTKIVEALQGKLSDAHVPTPDQVILDFDAPSPAGSWYADGVAFGLAPIPTGQILLGNTVEKPLIGVAVRGIARRDPAFANLHASPGNEPDVGELAQWNRAGQSLRTPTITLKTGKLWYLVRGAGRAYAVVDSHLIVMGPLHGALLHQWNDKADTWKWIHHDLSAYAGQRCHVEFSPNGAGDFEIAKVIEADAPPAVDGPNGTVLSAITGSDVTSIETLAREYQRLLQTAANRLAQGAIAGSADSHDQAAIADFLVGHPALFHDDTSTAASTTDAARQFIPAQLDLQSKIILASPTALAMWDGNGVDENLLIRGVPKTPGELTPRRFLEAISGSNQTPYPTDTSGRMRLVEVMLGDDDPFVSRVMVNRVWQHLFGRGIVPTVDNFGVLGQPPTHPELLDYLAEHFRTDQAWSVKKLIRSIMLSSSYQISSKASAEAEKADPENLLLTHMPIRRLEGEAIRDAILAVSGRLDAKIGGPPIEVNLNEFMDGRGRPGSGPLDGEGRRSIYMRVRRNFLPPMMMAFDTPTPFACVGRRNVSNVPAQALILMNDPMVIEQAKTWAGHLLAEPGKSPTDRIGTMYRTALGRQPRPREVQEMLKFLDDQGQEYGLPTEQRTTDIKPWADLCHVMFNLKEFVFVE